MASASSTPSGSRTTCAWLARALVCRACRPSARSSIIDSCRTPAPANLPIEPMDPEKARLAVDIGGTFTDVVVESRGRHWTTKSLTTHGAPEQGVIAAIETALAGAGLKPDDIGLIIHGT